MTTHSISTPSTDHSVSADHSVSISHSSAVLRVMTWNVWFGNFAQSIRMKGILDIIAQHQPDIVGLQELTSELLTFLESPEQILHQSYQRVFSEAFLQTSDDSAYWEGMYTRFQIGERSTRIEYEHTQMGRGLTILHCPELDLVVGTTHLESMDYWNYRKVQAEEALAYLNAMNTRNAIFMGDMNFHGDEGIEPLPPGWVDAWDTLYPHDPGYSREYPTNAMLTKQVQERLDRIYIRTQDFTLRSMERLGTTPLVTLTEEPSSEFDPHTSMVVPGRMPRRAIFPSDHFGLLLTLEHKTH